MLSSRDLTFGLRETGLGTKFARPLHRLTAKPSWKSSGDDVEKKSRHMAGS